MKAKGTEIESAPRYPCGTLKENDADAEVGFFEEAVPQLPDGVGEDLARDLGQDAGSVAGLGIGVDRSPVSQIADRRQAQTQHVV